MSRAAVALVGLALVATTGCKTKAATSSEVANIESGSSGSESSGSGSTGSGSSSAMLASLPGELWFMDDSQPRKLVRIRGGKRTEIVDDLFPSRARLPDGRLIAIASKGDGSPESEQLVLVAPDGVTRIGPLSSQIRDPFAAADGSWIVAAVMTNGISNLHRIDLATGAATQITDNREGNFHPASLGGDAMVFLSSRDGDSEIYRGSVKGGRATRLTAFHKEDYEPLPSPDHKMIAFLSTREGTASRIFLMNADGTDQRRLTRSPGDGPNDEVQMAWSPDGTLVAYASRNGSVSRLIVHEIATGEERELTPAEINDADPVFSPEGRWIVVSRSPRARDNDHDLWALPVGDGDPIQITSSSGGAWIPRWF